MGSGLLPQIKKSRKGMEDGMGKEGKTASKEKPAIIESITCKSELAERD